MFLAPSVDKKLIRYFSGEAKKMLTAGGFYLNNARVTEDRSLSTEDLIDGRIVILRTGKDNHVILALEQN